MARKRKDLCVEVRCELDGKIYSRVIDRAVETPYGDLTRVDGVMRYVVIDRATGRQLDAETVMNRAQYLAELMGVDYHEDLTWPCEAEHGFKDCNCPRCSKSADDRATK